MAVLAHILHLLYIAITSKTNVIVEAPNPHNPERSYRAALGDKPIHTSFSTVILDAKRELFLGRNELVRRLLADLKRKHHVAKQKPDWMKLRLMLAHNRKIIVVCQQCHNDIHGGQ